MPTSCTLPSGVKRFPSLDDFAPAAMPPIEAEDAPSVAAALAPGRTRPMTRTDGWPIVAWQGVRLIAEGITCTAVFGGYVIAFYRDLARQIYTLVRR